MRKGTRRKGTRYCPNRHFHPSTPGNVATHAASRRAVAFTSANTDCVCVCSDTVPRLSGSMSTHSGLSRNTRSSTLGGSMGARKSALNSAPRAPAEQPPNSRRLVPAEGAPRPMCATSTASVASMMRCPLKAHPSPPATFFVVASAVASAAEMSPTQASDEQYPICTRFAPAHGLRAGLVSKMPVSCRKTGQRGSPLGNLLLVR